MKIRVDLDDDLPLEKPLKCFDNNKHYYQIFQKNLGIN